MRWRTVLVLVMVMVSFVVSPSAFAGILYNVIDLGDGHPYSINDNGQIVGATLNESGHTRATLYDATGGGNNIGLGGLPWGGQSIAHSINNNGQIVGAAQDGGGRQPILFDATGGGNNINLNGDDIISGAYAYSINDTGQIVGA